MKRYHGCSGRHSAVWMLAILLLPLVAATSSAQRWEYFYGGTSTEAGHGGVQPVSSGGYIAAGESQSTPTPDIYVVRTDDRGGKFWEATYDIAGNSDYAYDVLELANGEFAITGFTTNYYNGVNRNDMFILILDRCGAVLRFRTFGTQDYYETGYDIIEARSGDPLHYTQPGDLIVAGFTTWTYPDRGASDGWLIRVDRNLNIIWSRRYEVGNGEVNNFSNDTLFALDECMATPPSPYNTTTHDIVAVGTTNSPNFTFGNFDGWMLRVDGNTGLTPVVGSLGVGVHGGAGSDGFYSVEELEEDTNANRGNIVAVGYTMSTSNAEEVYLVRTPPQVWLRVNDRTLGDNNGNENDGGYCVREIRVSDTGLTRGNLIVTGYVTFSSDIDFFLQEYQGNLTAVGQVTKVYGGIRRDVGRSVAPVGRKGNCRTAGFIACGYSSSLLCDNVDPQDMYLLKTDNARTTLCNDYNLDRQDLVPGLPWAKVAAKIDSLNDFVDTTVKCKDRNWGCLLCVRADGTMLCPIPPCPALNCNDTIVPPPDTLIDPPAKPAPGGDREAAETVLYPNPVRTGQPFAIDFEMAREATVIITVTDVNGEVIEASRSGHAAGRRLFTLDTGRWTPGTYLIRISDGMRTTTAKVVVVE